MRAKNIKAFSLMDLLSVIALIALLNALLMRALAAAKAGETASLLVCFCAIITLVLAIVVMLKFNTKLKDYGYKWETPLIGGIILAFTLGWTGLIPKNPVVFTFATVGGMWLSIGVAWLLNLRKNR